MKFSGAKYSRKAFLFTSRVGTDKGKLEIRLNPRLTSLHRSRAQRPPVP
jgi:uncharacterized protein YheU (UPF0270 family)